MTNMHDAPTSAGADLGKALVAALGLPARTSKLTLRMDGNKPPTVEIEFFPDAEALRGAAAAIQPLAGRYVLQDAGPAGKAVSGEQKPDVRQALDEAVRSRETMLNASRELLRKARENVSKACRLVETQELAVKQAADELASIELRNPVL